MKNSNENEDCGCAMSAKTEVSGVERAESVPAAEEKSLQPKSLLASDSVTYGYDSRGRLQTVTFANGTVVTYNYDACGNRTSVVTTCPGGTC